MKCVRMCALFELILTFFFLLCSFSCAAFSFYFWRQSNFFNTQTQEKQNCNDSFLSVSNNVLFASISLIILYATHTYALRHFSSFSSRRVCFFFRSLKEHFVVLTRRKTKTNLWNCTISYRQRNNCVSQANVMDERNVYIFRSLRFSNTSYQNREQNQRIQ